jgi:hypothetical protein
MAVWFMRCLLCEKFTLFRAEITADAEAWQHQQNNRRNNVLRIRECAHALNHGGAID